MTIKDDLIKKLKKVHEEFLSTAESYNTESCYDDFAGDNLNGRALGYERAADRIKELLDELESK